MVKQAKLFKVFEQTKAFMIGMGSAMDVLQGLGADYPDGVWASGRYYFGYPDSPENKRFNDAVQKRWNTYPSYPSETAYTALFALKKAVEKARSIETEKVIAALEGLELDRPAGKCVIRNEDHQAVYAVPWGQIKHDPKFPMPTLRTSRCSPPTSTTASRRSRRSRLAAAAAGRLATPEREHSRVQIVR